MLENLLAPSSIRYREFASKRNREWLMVPMDIGAVVASSKKEAETEFKQHIKARKPFISPSEAKRIAKAKQISAFYIVGRYGLPKTW